MITASPPDVRPRSDRTQMVVRELIVRVLLLFPDNSESGYNAFMGHVAPGAEFGEISPARAYPLPPPCPGRQFSKEEIR